MAQFKSSIEEGGGLEREKKRGQEGRARRRGEKRAGGLALLTSLYLGETMKGEQFVPLN